MNLTKTAAATVNALARECTVSEVQNAGTFPEGTTRQQIACALNHAFTSGLIDRVHKGSIGSASEQDPTIFAPAVKRASFPRVSSVFDLGAQAA